MPSVSKAQSKKLNAKFGHASKYKDDKPGYLRAWRKANESYVRDKEYRKRFGITLDDYEGMLAAQNGVCAICKEACKRGRLGVDHDHETGRVRGLLCRSCNIILGQLEDDPEWLKNAEVYLASGIRSATAQVGLQVRNRLDASPPL